MQASFIPRAVHVVTTRDDGQKADEAVDGLMEHLAIALITVSFIMLLFLGWREALIVSVTVPVIFSITLGADLLRSEEHTSELQSLMRISYAVFCLKKKKKQILIHDLRRYKSMQSSICK